MGVLVPVIKAQEGTRGHKRWPIYIYIYIDCNAALMLYNSAF